MLSSIKTALRFTSIKFGMQHSLRSSIVFYLVVSLFSLGGLVLNPKSAHAAGVVSSCSASALNAALTGGGTVTFSTGDCTITLGAWIQISANTVIDGAGQTITISGGDVVSLFLVNSPYSLTLRNLTLTHGGDPSGSTGAVLNNKGTLTLDYVTFSYNHVNSGNIGAITNSGTGTLTISNSVLSNNTDLHFSRLIYNVNDLGNPGPINISNTTITGNTTQNSIPLIETTANSLSISNSTISNNTTTAPQLILHGGTTLTLTSNIISDNSSNTGRLITNNGGAVTIASTTISDTVPGGSPVIENLTSQTVTVSDSTITGNSGSALYTFTGMLNISNSSITSNAGGILSDGGRVNILNSLFSGNTAGGYFNSTITTSGAVVNIANSTFSGNSTTASGAASVLSVTSGTLNISNSTFINNSTGGTATVAYLSTTVKLRNNLFASNTGGDCQNIGSSTTAGSTNNLSAISCPGSIGTPNGVNLTLANNGGPTLTHAISLPSNAINGVTTCTYSNTGTNPLFSNGATITTDQRGITRPQSGKCDIGAFEYNATAVGVPSLAAAFSPTLTSLTHAANLTFTIDNSQANANVLSDLAFQDDLAGTNLVINGTSAVQNTCNFTFSTSLTVGGTLINVTNGSVSAGGTCLLTIPIMPNATGSLSTTTGNLTSSSGTSNTANASLTVVSNTPSTLNFAQQPTTHSAGVFSPVVTVEVKDGAGYVVTSDNTTQVTMAIGNNPSGATLSGTTTMTAVNGIVTFSNLGLVKVGTGYTLTASSGSLTGATSNAFNITPGPAAQLQFVQQPSAATAGVSISPAVTVVVQDAYGNTITSNNTTQITLAIANNAGGGTLSGTTTVTVASGVATFSNLSIDKSGTGYTLLASATGLTSSTSGAFNITPGPAVKLGFSQQPTNTTAGAVFSPNLKASVQDSFGNTVTTNNTAQITLSMGNNPNGAALFGTTTVTAVNGTATFTTVNIRKAGTGFTIAAASTGLTSTTSTSFNITAGAATKLLYTTQPSNVSAGAKMATVRVSVRDTYTNLVTTDNTTQITLSISNNPGGSTLTGGGPITVVNGTAAFTQITLNRPGTGYTLTANSTPAYTAVVSNAFNVVIGPAAKLSFIQQPTSTQSGQTITPAITAAVQDIAGNTITTNNTTQITLAIGTNPGSGTLSGTTTVTVASGVATFPNLSINNGGTGYRLVASASGLTSATSNSFNVIVVATQLGFVQQPPTTGYTNTIFSPALTVQLLNASSQPVGQGGVSITLAFGANPGSGTLSGVLTRTTNSTGLATFPNLSINNAGTGYTLVASASGLTSATTTSFNIVPAPTKLGFVQQPPATGYTNTAFSPALTVQLLDVNSQPVGKSGVSITLAFGANPGSSTLSGILTRTTNSAGLATFSGLSINNAGNGYTLVASSSGLTSTTSTSFNIVPAPTQVVFVQQPPATVNTGTTLSPAVTVRLLDVNGQPVNKIGVPITMAIGNNPGGGTLSGTLTRTTNSSGVATFNNLSINNAGTGYTLVASSSGLTSATSSSFDVTTGSPSGPIVPTPVPTFTPR
jgi:hypothetical protein